VTTEAVAQVIEQLERPYQVASDILGPSKIQTYLYCPLSFRLRYIDRVPTLPRAEPALGTAIHGVIAYAHTQRWSERQADEAAEMLEEIWDGIEPTGKDEPDVTIAYRQARDVWIPAYLQWSCGQETVCIEERWRCDVDDDGQEIPLQGTIDRVYRDSDGRLVVSDVKSGARAPSKADVATHLQLSLYAWAFQQATGSNGNEVLELVHLRGFGSKAEEKLFSFRTRRSPEYLDAVIDHVVIPVHRQIAAGQFPANPGGLYGCNHCDVQHACPIGQGGECNTYGN
jgi:hypothetical protein